MNNSNDENDTANCNDIRNENENDSPLIILKNLKMTLISKT